MHPLLKSFAATVGELACLGVFAVAVGVISIAMGA
jgi:hypothetical protein